MKNGVLLLFLSSFLFCGSVFSQCQNERAEKIGQYWSKEIATTCTNYPKKLKIEVIRCVYEKNLKDGLGGWKIWTSVEWQGKYTTIDYSVKLYIEDIEPNGKLAGNTMVYFLDYSITLQYRCIDIKNTRPLTLVAGTVEHFPFKEFAHWEPNN